MKKIFIICLLIVITGSALALPNIASRPNERWYSDTTYQNPLWAWLQEANAAIEGGQALGTGKVFYVDSNVVNEGDGSNWANATDTLDEAINLCTANRGDVIYVAQGHAETIAAADGFDADVAGIKIKGLGNGTDAPKFTFSATDSDVAIGAANVSITNVRFLAGVSAIVRGISVEDAGDNCTIAYCVFPEPTTSTFEFVRAVLLADAADGFHFIGNTYFNIGAVGGTNVIDADTAIVDDLKIIGNLIVGEFAEGAIHSDKACTNVVCNGNMVTNLTSGEHAIEFSGNALGFLVGNRVETNAIATAIDNGSLSSHDNTWLTPQGADTEATQVNPTVDSTTTILGADDSSNAFVSSSVTADADGSILERLEKIDVDAEIISAAASPSTSHPNYFVVTADMTSATWNTAAAHEIADVTGAVRLTVLAECTDNIITASTNGTIALGLAGNTSAFWAAALLDTWDATEVAMGVTAGVPTFPVGGGEGQSALTHCMFDIVAMGGIDVGYTIGVNAGTNGVIKFHVWWTPLDATGAVTAGAGGPF